MNNKYLNCSIDGTINADELILGKGVQIEKDVLITGKNGPAKKVVLGDFCFIGSNTKIITPEFSLGDYSKINAYTFAHGTNPMHIGRNCWFGGNVVLDSIGGLDIDDNVGIGAHSQIWTHIQFGDIVEGSRFHSQKYMYIGKDAWFVGHCIVSPVKVGERSMAMVGSVITRDMEPNHIYAGVPAKDITDKMGTQFEQRTLQQKVKKLEEIISLFYNSHPEFRDQLKIVTSPDQIVQDICCFDVSRRVYTKIYSEAEVVFLKTNIPLIKFTPDGEGPFVNPKSDLV